MDLDLANELQDQILVERDGYAFLVDIEYEKLPMFCTSCSVIGHTISHCKRLNVVNDKGNLGAKKSVARYILKNPDNKSPKYQKPIDLDPMVMQKSLDKGKAILVENSHNDSLHAKTSKQSGRQLIQNEIPQFDQVKGPDFVVDVDLRRNVNPVMRRNEHPLIQHSDEEESIETIFDKEVTPFTSQAKINEVRDFPDHVSDSIKGSDSRNEMTNSNKGSNVRIIHSAKNIPVRVVRDLSKMNDRWADIVGESPLDDPPNVDPNAPKDGFEVVLTKSQKKKLRQKKKIVVQSDYKTRSMVGKQGFPQ